ncbi:hypothetical protein NPIL_164971 [Nephila pilipes]|uniref:Uncharacterized protein n=1 Tax=Nephila pilipes TaxID=299642 RepID=A0A8X6U1B0_NEPPI|nr:hypothetical protein NPIL_164971 [Nephila pilipes]
MVRLLRAFIWIQNWRGKAYETAIEEDFQEQTNEALTCVIRQIRTINDKFNGRAVILVIVPEGDPLNDD